MRERVCISFLQADIWGIGVCLLTVIRELSKRLQKVDMDIPQDWQHLALGKLQEKDAKIFEHALEKVMYCKQLHPMLQKLLEKDADSRPDAVDVVKELQCILVVRAHMFTDMLRCVYCRIARHH